ncbi:MAG: enoyl-CoA hydratase/isomerase family protein [Deltaproteobacteria bacterium]|nr:enoyl-CoA hydratase/isomerase family protein [Deltaproteobacteria bacterium]MDQ3299190.1 enoyl-CoA hydratase-related protein [Myxococcota bacterium]
MSYNGFETLKVDVDGPIATVTIRREQQLNALSSVVIAELTQIVGELEVSTDVRVVIVTGAGEKAFVAGADIAEMVEMTPIQATAFAEMGGSLGNAIETSEKPWIAAVNGFALGGGCELALACDFIHASEKATFGQPEVKLGVIPGFGGTQRLSRRVGVAKAKELCMTGDTVKAPEALRIGLVDAVWPDAELLPKVRELAMRIAANGPLAVAEVKRLIHQGQSTSLEHALALEQRSFGLLFATTDQREGMSAFLAKPKRAAQFKGQ